MRPEKSPSSHALSDHHDHACWLRLHEVHRNPAAAFLRKSKGQARYLVEAEPGNKIGARLTGVGEDKRAVSTASPLGDRDV